MPPDAAFARNEPLAPVPLRARRIRRFRQAIMVARGSNDPCGLTHRFSCTSWPSLAALIWWMLRNKNMR